MLALPPTASSSSTSNSKPTSVSTLTAGSGRVVNMEFKEDWIYEGLPLNMEFGDADVRLKIRNAVWESVKSICLGEIFVTVNEVKKDSPGKFLDIIISEFMVIKKKFSRLSNSNSRKPIAKINVTSEPRNSYFVFKILDKELAQTKRISAGTLYLAAVSAFGTCIVQTRVPEEGQGKVRTYEMDRYNQVYEQIPVEEGDQIEDDDILVTIEFSDDSFQL